LGLLFGLFNREWQLAKAAAGAQAACDNLHDLGLVVVISISKHLVA
jgi:hypothetical protein